MCRRVPSGQSSDHRSGSVLLVDFLNSAYLAVLKSHLDAVGMIARVGENISDYPLGEGAGALVFFQNNGNPLSWLYVRSNFSVLHHIHPLFGRRENSQAVGAWRFFPFRRPMLYAMLAKEERNNDGR